MMLSAPGVWNPDWNEFAKRQFLVLCKRMTSTRDPLLSRLGVLWKQEIQKREAVHFHFVLWNVLPESALHVQSWIAHQWTSLVCVGLHPKAKAQHLAVHLHPTNFELVKHPKYFAKYLGKEEEASVGQHPIPGKWWGIFNRSNIPRSAKDQVPVSPQALIYAHRIFRKIRQVRWDESKHLALSKRGEMIRLSGSDKGKPIASRFAVQCGPKRAMYREWLAEITKHLYGKAERFSAFRCPPEYRIKECSVSLNFPGAPDLAKRILEYAQNREAENYSDIPY
jgi:hypothetical protein